MIVTHVHLGQIDLLVDVFATFKDDGDWALPEWLERWRERLEVENRDRFKPWPFAHEVVPRQVPREELIEKQYAHLPPKVKW